LSFESEVTLKTFAKKEMTLAYFIAAILILHFVVGIAYLIYKINTSKPNNDLKKEFLNCFIFLQEKQILFRFFWKYLAISVIKSIVVAIY
jgi:hypothetical protein